jgi:hypothetical protein
VKRRGTGRFAIAILAFALFAQLVVPRIITAGMHAGVLGVIASLAVAGGVFAILFTAIYDGPGAFLGAVRQPRGPSRRR